LYFSLIAIATDLRHRSQGSSGFAPFDSFYSPLAILPEHPAPIIGASIVHTRGSRRTAGE
ncbi:hypothetical protein CR513_26305, partial [Mucuna pruriens]